MFPQSTATVPGTVNADRRAGGNAARYVPNAALYNARDARGETQEQLAEALNVLGRKRGEAIAVSGNHVSRWERGLNRPGRLASQLLAEHFETTLEALGLTRPRGTRAQLRDVVLSTLTHAELAQALSASDMPTRRVSLTDQEWIDFAVQGLARLGLDSVRSHAEAAHQLNLRLVELADLNGGSVPVNSPACRLLDEQARQVWGCGMRRQDRAIDVAWKIVWYRQDCGLTGTTPAPTGDAALSAPVSVPPVLLTVPVPRCLGCGHRTATVHERCAPDINPGAWVPCGWCRGLRLDADGFECQECCGAGFIPMTGHDTLAERAGEEDLPRWRDDTDTRV